MGLALPDLIPPDLRYNEFGIIKSSDATFEETKSLARPKLFRLFKQHLHPNAHTQQWLTHRDLLTNQVDQAVIS